MSEAQDELSLSDDEKAALGNILYGNRAPFANLGPQSRAKYADKFDNQGDGGVNRGLDADSFMGDDTGPKFTRFESFETSFSDDDNGPYSMAFVAVVNDKVVTMHVHYPESSDDDEGGSLNDYEVFPLSQLEDALRGLKKGIAADGVRMLFDKLGKEEGFELLMQAMLEQRAKALKPAMEG